MFCFRDVHICNRLWFMLAVEQSTERSWICRTWQAVWAKTTVCIHDAASFTRSNKNIVSYKYIIHFITKFLVIIH